METLKIRLFVGGLVAMLFVVGVVIYNALTIGTFISFQLLPDFQRLELYTVRAFGGITFKINQYENIQTRTNDKPSNNSIKEFY